MCEETLEIQLEGEDLDLKTDDNDGLVFFINLSDPVPDGVHISKKSSCTVEIVPEDAEIASD